MLVEAYRTHELKVLEKEIPDYERRGIDEHEEG
jgi:hypothetical protein